MAFEHTQIFWGRHFLAPWTFLLHNTAPYVPFYTHWFKGVFLLGFGLLVAGLFLRIRISHSLLAAAFLTLYLSTSNMESAPRLLSVVFPFYITVALVATRWPRLEPLLLAGSAMLLMLSTVLFVNGYWFT